MSTRYFLSFFFFVIAALLIGCSDDDSGSCQPCPGDETIQGHVLGGAGPLEDIRVEARYMGPDENYRVTHTYQTAEDGRYAFDVMPGEYRLCIISLTGYQLISYGPTGLTCEWNTESELVIEDGAETLIADFRLGTLRIDLQLPQALVGAHLEIFVERHSEPGEWFGEESNQPGGETHPFILEGLPPGAYRASLEFRRLDMSPNTQSYVLDLSPFGDSVMVVAEEITTWSLAVPDPGYVTGTITGDWAQLNAGRPVVRVYGEDFRMFAEVEADSAGNFSIPVFAAGGARLRVRLGDLMRWIGGDDPESATVFYLDPGQPITIDPIPIGGLVCHISGDPAWSRSARLVLYDEAGDRRHTEYSGTNDTTLILPNLEPGTYALFYYWRNSSQWRPQWYDRATSLAEATPVLVDDTGGITEVTLTLEEGGRISGRVLAVDGSPAAGIPLIVYVPENELGWSWEWVTDGEGQFLIEGLPDGEVTLAAIVWGTLGSLDVWYPGVIEQGLAQPIVIEDAGTVSGVEWQLLSPQPGQVITYKADSLGLHL